MRGMVQERERWNLREKGHGRFLRRKEEMRQGIGSLILSRKQG